MKREEHKLAVRSRVLEVAKMLFVSKGYAKTTIKEIREQARITTGSLYHFFRDKEDIFKHITEEMFDLAANMADDMLPDDADPWLRLSVELAMQFHLLLNHTPIGELYLSAYESPAISRSIVRRAHKRNRAMFRESLPHISSDELYVMCLAIKGILHSFVQETIHGDGREEPGRIYRALDMVLLIFQIPGERKDGVIEKTLEVIDRVGR